MSVQNALACVKELNEQGAMTKDTYTRAIWNLLDSTECDVFKRREA